MEAGRGILRCHVLGHYLAALRIDKKFMDRAPHMVKGLHGREGEFFVCENISPIPVAAAFGAGIPSEQLPQKGRVIVWSVLGTLFLGIAANFIYGWLVATLLH